MYKLNESHEHELGNFLRIANDCCNEALKELKDPLKFLARIIHELLREGIFSFSCVDSKSIWASRIRFAGALVVKTLQTEF